MVSFYKDKEVAVVGGGNTADEEALYLSNIAIRSPSSSTGLSLEQKQ